MQEESRAIRLRTILFRLVIGTVFPVILLSMALGVALVHYQRTTLERGVVDRTRAFVTTIDAELQGNLRALTILASARSLERHDLRAFHENAARALGSQPDWLTVLLSLPDGRQVVNASRPFGDGLRSNVDMESTARVVATREAAIGNLTLGPFRRSYGIPLRVPVYADGRLAYVATAVVRPEAFQRLIAAQNLPADWAAAIVDRAGVLVARIPAKPPGTRAAPDLLAQMKLESEGWYRGATLEGADTFAAHIRSNASGWTAAIAVPTRIVYGAGYTTGIVFLIGSLLSLVTAFVFAYVRARAIARPIASLADAARRFGSGEALEAPVASANIVEVRDMAQAFSSASAAIAQRQQLLEHEQAALKAADQAKDEFIAMLGHELRNPLSAIAVSNQVLALSPDPLPSSRRAKGVIDRQLRHMTRIVDDLLDVARLSRGKVELRKETFDLSALCRAVVETFPALTGRPGRIEVRAADPAWVHADRTRMEQVLTNLLDNAVKYSPDAAAISVTVQRTGDDVVLRVADEGHGIPAELVERIFDAFVQGPASSDRKRGGIGVGLTLVRHIVELHGGSVAAQSGGADLGATFTVTLRAAAAPTETFADAPSADTRPCDVLVVEDNEDAREMIAHLLASRGHRVREAADGPAALAAIEASPPDVALIDIGLPGIDGHEVARRVRRSVRGRDIRLVAVTGYGQESDVRLALDAGFDLHVTKPVTAEALHAALGR